jgi:hypothetical protein
MQFFNSQLKYSRTCEYKHLDACPKPGKSRTGFGQVKIMKEFIRMNRNFSIFGFQVKTIKAKTV